MTIPTTYAKLVDIVEATSGINSAPDALPPLLPEHLLPIGLVRVGPATWNEHAIGLYRQVRIYAIDVFVKPVSEGVTPDEGYKACLTPLYNLGRALVQDLTLGGTVDQIGVGSRPEFNDSGVRADLAYAGRAYYGFTLTLQVTEKAS